MFGPFRLFYYFSRLEMSFALLFENDWFAWEVSYERKSLINSFRMFCQQKGFSLNLQC